MASGDRSRPPVLIAGAGPTGLLLALWLQRFSVPFRIIDRASTTTTTSRALVVHARTLELYRQLGIADEVIATGTRVRRFIINHGGKPKGYIEVAENGKGLSRYPFILSIPQDRHETLLQDILLRRGGKVERGVELTGLSQNDADAGVTVQLRAANGGQGEEGFLASYLAGCDGAHSAVRAATDIKMTGGTYNGLFYVADVQVTGPMASADEMNMCLSSKDLCVMIPLQELGRARLVGYVPASMQDAAEKLSFEDVLPSVRRNTAVTVDKVNWFSHYKVHHRAASSFRHGRVFLLGDSAHLHSPVGGQGMNTGLGDATNLAWKLATVFHRDPNSPGTSFSENELLNTYEQERIGFANKLINTTDYVFTLMIANTLLGRFLRNIFFPYLAPLIIRLANLGPRIYRKTSQIEVEYRGSALSRTPSAKTPGKTRPGDRLPWVEIALERGAKESTEVGTKGAAGDNHAVLDSKWQAHVYGEVAGATRQVLRQLQIPLHVFAYTKQAEAAGLARDATYLVRPDGHVGTIFPQKAGGGSDGKDGMKVALGEYYDRWGIGDQAF